MSQKARRDGAVCDEAGPYLTSGQAAGRLGICLRTLERLVAEEHLTIYRLPGRTGGRRWFRVEELDNLLVAEAEQAGDAE
jgi:excisionase family DNA binding protein